MMIFDFTNGTSVDDWSEVSDTVRDLGMSKAVLTLQRTQKFQRGIFFTLLNPQPNGAGFAGAKISGRWNLENFDHLEINCRGQGQNKMYKIVLKNDKPPPNYEDISYEQIFEIVLNDDNFSDIKLPLKDFKPFHRGKYIPAADPLDTSNINSLGLQVFGGVYCNYKQKGASSLEINNITVTKSSLE